jgi:hypothetical protein
MVFMEENNELYLGKPKKPREVKPWDLLDAKNYDSDEEKVAARMAICLECPLLLKPGKICSKCKCMMSFKTKLHSAHCPIGKW